MERFSGQGLKTCLRCVPPLCSTDHIIELCVCLGDGSPSVIHLLTELPHVLISSHLKTTPIHTHGHTHTHECNLTGHKAWAWPTQPSQVSSISQVINLRAQKRNMLHIYGVKTHTILTESHQSSVPIALNHDASVRCHTEASLQIV